jgi:tetratricopeptide (TPR) repeat protein
MTAQQAIGSFLRAARETQKLTQEQVASMTRGTPWRLSRAAISAIERGQNFPGMEAMLALSNVLFVDPKQLVERARLSTTVPVDVTGLDYDELDKRATACFWEGDFRQALAVYDAMLEMIALGDEGSTDETRARIAALEVRRATALKRAGALLSAIATAERAISLSVSTPRTQAEAYIVLADLQCQRGHLPLATDAAGRAIELARAVDSRTLGWAWMVLAHTRFLEGKFEQAREDFLEARRFARDADDKLHMTHIEGDIGMCYLALGEVDDARKWVRRAVELAQRQGQPTLEASWLVELGKIAFRHGSTEEAENYAAAALQIAKPHEQYLTIFRAEWLRHRLVKAEDPSASDRHRLAYLRKLYQQLDQHEGIEEVQEFRKSALRQLEAETGRPS